MNPNTAEASTGVVFYNYRAVAAYTATAVEHNTSIPVPQRDHLLLSHRGLRGRTLAASCFPVVAVGLLLLLPRPPIAAAEEDGLLAAQSNTGSAAASSSTFHRFVEGCMVHSSTASTPTQHSSQQRDCCVCLLGLVDRAGEDKARRSVNACIIYPAISWLRPPQICARPPQRLWYYRTVLYIIP